MNKWTNTAEHWKHIHTCRDKKWWVSNFGTSKNMLKRCWNMFWHVFGSHLKAPTRVRLGYPGSDAMETVVCDRRTNRSRFLVGLRPKSDLLLSSFSRKHMLFPRICASFRYMYIYIHIHHIQHIHHIHHIPISSISSLSTPQWLAAGESPHPRSCWRSGRWWIQLLHGAGAKLAGAAERSGTRQVGPKLYQQNGGSGCIMETYWGYHGIFMEHIIHEIIFRM